MKQKVQRVLLKPFILEPTGYMIPEDIGLFLIAGSFISNRL